MDVTFDRIDGVLFVSVSGRLDAGQAVAFEKTVRTEIEDGDRAVIMDFATLEYLGSAGLRVIFMTASALQKRGAGFALCAPPKPVAKVIHLSGMEQVVPVYPSRADALAAL